jgi:phage terminase Nu1 subunit (DNA packaging protein)
MAAKPKFVTQAQFASMMKVAPKTVTVWKQRGHLVLHGDKVDVAASKARLAKRPDIYRGGKARDSSRPPPETTPREEARARLARGEVEMLPLAEAQAKKENYLALLRQLEYEKARGELIHIQLAKRGWTMIVTAFRERCLALPGKLAMFGPEVEMAARDEIYECLEELSRPVLSVDEPPRLDDGTTNATGDAADDGASK